MRPLPFICCALALGAGAADARVRWSTPGSYRLRVEALPDIPLAADTTSEQNLRGRHRLRLDPTVEMGPVVLRLQIDVLTGQIFGDPQPIGAAFVERRAGDPEDPLDGWETVEPRMIWAEYTADWGGVVVGQLGAAWGMGLLDSPGYDDPAEEVRGVERFGDRWFGDLVDRVEVRVRPLAPFTLRPAGDLVLAVGVDHVYQDDQASFLDDDTAIRAFGKLYYPGELVFAGAYVVYRDQRDAEGGALSAVTTDVFLRWDVPLYRLAADLRVQAEALVQVGETDRGGVAQDILAAGGAVRAELQWRCPEIAVGGEAGYASGDGDAGDGVRHDLALDPDHRVGLILFSDVLRFRRLAALDAAGGGAPDARSSPPNGAVTDALYVFPGVTWRPTDWRLTLAGLAAWTADTEDLYGLELDGSAHYDWQPVPAFRLSAGVQGGVLFPGPALAPAEDPLWKAVGRLDLRW